MSPAAERRICPACGGLGHPEPGYESVDLDRCGRCGLIFLGRVDVGGTESKYASGEYADSHLDYFDEDASFAHIARKRVGWLTDRAEPGRLLELGPGRGHFLAAANDAGFEVIGVEASPSLARRIEVDFDVPVEQGFLEEVELPRDGFDFICMFHVFEHIEDPPGLLRRIHELLAPGGLVAIEVPNIGSAMAARRGDTWGAVQLVDLHISHFTPETLSPLVAAAGFDVVDVDTISVWPYLERGRRYRPRALGGYAFRAAKLRTLRSTHPTGMDNLRLLATSRA